MLADNTIQPSLQEIQEAKKHPGEWLYRIATSCGQTASVPPEAILGAWKVNPDGCISGEFLRNANYDDQRWPS